jgi:hypothetical protein
METGRISATAKRDLVISIKAKMLGKNNGRGLVPAGSLTCEGLVPGIRRIREGLRGRPKKSA